VLTLPAQTHLARFLSSWTPGVAAHPGTLLMVSSQPVSATAVSWSMTRRAFFEIPMHAASHRPMVVLGGGRLVDGTGAAAQPQGALAMMKGRILFAGSEQDLVVRESDERIDLAGRTILPGFFNTHVHNSFNEANLAAWALAGVTTVRDLGLDRSLWPGAAAFQARIAGTPGYARIISSGPMMTVSGGYPMVRWGVAGTIVASPSDARQKAAQLLQEGAQLIKIALETGFCCRGNGWPMLSPEETTAIVNLAHERGTKVSAHVSESAKLQQAVETGVDDLAHMVVDDQLDDGIVSKLVAKGIYWVPTLELWSGAGSWFAQNSVRNLRRFVLAGGQVALGTDYYGAPRPFELGMPMIEMRLMKEAGMSPMQIIVAGTRNAARVSNCEDILGTLEPGKIADVLVVDGDPLADLEALSRPWMVIQNGLVIRK